MVGKAEGPLCPVEAMVRYRSKGRGAWPIVYVPEQQTSVKEQVCYPSPRSTEDNGDR